MKQVLHLCSKIRGLFSASQGNDVGYDCRLTVVRPSFDRRSTMLKLCSILVIVLTVGVGNAWGTDVTTTFKNYTSGTWATNKNPLPYNSGGVGWASSATPNSFESSGSKRGLQWSSATATTLTTSAITGTITNVTIVASTNGTVSLSVTVGSTDFTVDDTDDTSVSVSSTANQSYSFNGSASGTISVSVNNTNKSAYVKSITVTYSTSTSYTITFKEWDGGGAASGSPSTGSVTANATSFSFGATAPSKTGHNIEGFYTNTSASSGVKVANSSRQFIASITDWTDKDKKYIKGANANLYIKWQANVYTVSTDFTNISVSSAFPSSFTYTGSTTTDLNRTLSVTSSYALPSDLTVTMGGNACTKGAEYSYNSSTGAFSFDVAITGDISISGSAIPYRTITFNDNGNTTVETWLQGSSHATPTITGCTEYTPLGWTTTAPTSNAWASQPSYTAGGNNITVPSSNTTYYAVYTTGTPSTDYVRTSSITSGANYVITYAGQKALDASEYYYDDDYTPADYFFGTADVSESSSTISNPGANLIWRITGDNTNGYEIYNANQDRYLGFDADDNEMYLYDDSHTDYTITFSSQNCYIQPKADDDYYFYEKRFGTSGSYSYWFDIYTSSGYNILFKQSVTTSYISNPACCDAPTALTKGSFL